MFSSIDEQPGFIMIFHNFCSDSRSWSGWNIDGSMLHLFYWKIGTLFNSLGLSDAIWSGSILFQAMTCFWPQHIITWTNIDLPSIMPLAFSKGQFHRKRSRYHPLKMFGYYIFGNTSTSSQSQRFNDNRTCRINTNNSFPYTYYSA